LIASIPATTADPASFATSCATRVTRAIGAGIFEDFPVAALREDAVAALRFVLERPLFADALERPVVALRVLLAALAAAADRPRDFVFFDLFLLPPRVEAVLPDFPRDFLALVAIDALLRVVIGKTISTIARIRHIRKAFRRLRTQTVGQGFRFV
jgi:hypothetical protein